MKKNLIVALLFIIASNVLMAQKYYAPHNARYSPDMTLKQLYNIEFLQKMSKEDWVLFTQDPRFDADKVVKLKTEWKKKHQKEKGAQKSLQTSGETNCKWIAPDNSCENPNTIQWPGSPGNSTDNYSAPISLGWNFNYFGQNFNTVVLTTKGTIVLGNNGYIDFTPSAFPDPLTTESTQQYDHICGFWTDFDFAASGELYYCLSPEGLIVTYENVGYWPNNDDRVNTFQMIITPDGSDLIGNGNNVQFTYFDMQFANSQISGATGGCGAINNLAIVGCDRISGTQHYAFGRFNVCDSEQYNGPYGVNANQQDGVDWLDGRVIAFNTGVSNFNVNQPPVPLGEACDTVTMCVGETFNFNLGFTSPEATQSTSITYTQSGTGFSATSTSGNAAILNNASFTASASNVGTNTVTITATDNGTPVASKVVTYVFIVDDIVPPPISISGVLNICAGQATELTASDGFDSYTWSNGSSGQTVEVNTNGPITVIGHYGLCSAVATEQIDVTPYFIPALCGGNIPIEICPGIDTTICVVDTYASYSWSVNTGFDGEFVAGAPLDEQSTQVTGNVDGNYIVYVTDTAGCQGFNIKLVNSTPVSVCESNEENNGAFCNGLTALDFCGYSVPPEDNLIVYGLSTNQNGWQGSYINVYLYPADGGPMETFFFTTFTNFGLFDDVIIGAGDSIAIEFFSNGNNQPGNSLWVINCGQNNPTVINAPLQDGIVWSAMSTCYPTALPGTWTVTGPGGWTLTDATQMTTTFTPTQYGVYELCFSNESCDNDYCYNVEYTQPPSATITPAVDQNICGNTIVDVSALLIDPSGSGTVNWSGSNVVGDGSTATAGPYTGYTSTEVTVSVTNVCGTATDSFTLNHIADPATPVLNDAPLCNNGALTLDPVPNNQDNPNLVYSWTGTQGTASTSTLSVNQPGTYNVVVSNLCGQSPMATANIYGVVQATVTTQPPANILECNANSVPLSVAYNNGPAYTASWTGPVNSSNASVTANADGQYCYDVTDIFGCNTHATGCTQVEISSAPSTTSGSADVLALCPRECKALDMVVTGEDATFSWTTSCNGYPINSNSGSISYCADNVPKDCLGAPITITGTVSNLCGSDQAFWTIQSNACEVIIPNVFTPNGGNGNDSFVIKGLENYSGSKLQIFNRWGNVVFESDNYRNDWRGQDVEDGTYWYLLTLPYGVKTDHKGFIEVLR